MMKCADFIISYAAYRPGSGAGDATPRNDHVGSNIPVGSCRSALSTYGFATAIEDSRFVPTALAP